MFLLLYCQIVPAVTELIAAQFLWLDYDDRTKPIYLYINSTGTMVSSLNIEKYEIISPVSSVVLALFT